jgi:hypothetical protein
MWPILTALYLGTIVPIWLPLSNTLLGTHYIKHHNRVLEILPHRPILAYAVARGPMTFIPYAVNTTSGDTVYHDSCAGETSAYITEDNCLTRGCIDVVWIWEGVPHFDGEKHHLFSQETFDLWDLYEKVTGNSSDSMLYPKCYGPVSDEGSCRSEPSATAPVLA